MGVKKIFISGNGILGTALCLELAKKFNVIIGCHSEPAGIIDRDIRCLKIDICDMNSLKTLDDIAPDIIIHTAALTNVESCEENPEFAYEVNVSGTRNILERAKRSGSKFIYISSDYIFDGEKGNYSETDQPNPLSVYGSTKLEGEKLVLAYKHSLIIRTTFFGWHPQADKWHFSFWIINSLRQNKRIYVACDQKNSILCVLDLARSIHNMISAGLSGVYNVASRNSMSIYDIALEFSKSFNLDKNLIDPVSVDFTREKFGLLAKRPKDVSLNVSKMQRDMNILMPLIQEGIIYFKESGLYDRLNGVSHNKS